MIIIRCQALLPKLKLIYLKLFNLKIMFSISNSRGQHSPFVVSKEQHKLQLIFDASEIPDGNYTASD